MLPSFFMSNNPNPDFIQEIMEEDFGTRVLITNPAADRYLEQHKINQLKKKFNKEWFDDDQSN